LLALLLAVAHAACERARSTAPPPVRIVTHPHRSITFIVGEDKTYNKYYTNAARYFTLHEADSEHQVVIAPLSLAEIMERLNQLPTGYRWSDINIVSHGNTWTGLATRVYPGGPRTTVETLIEAEQDGRLPALRTGIFDDSSHVVFYACGLGRDLPLMQKLKSVFSAPHTAPKVSSTKLFNIFSAGRTKAVHSLADFYHVFYRPGHHPGNTVLADRFKARYPGVSIDWADALSRKLPDHPGQPFSYKYHIPVSWTEVYRTDETPPHLQTQDEIINWILDQEDFLHLIRRYGIPIDRFQWSVRYFTYRDDTGEARPAMKVKGRVTVMSVLREVVDDRGRAFVPDLSDERFFTTM